MAAGGRKRGENTGTPAVPPPACGGAGSWVIGPEQRWNNSGSHASASRGKQTTTRPGSCFGIFSELGEKLEKLRGNVGGRSETSGSGLTVHLSPSAFSGSSGTGPDFTSSLLGSLAGPSRSQQVRERRLAPSSNILSSVLQRCLDSTAAGSSDPSELVSAPPPPEPPESSLRPPEQH